MRGKEKPLISVIVPIYNAERYLDTCLSSLISQTYEKIEIILINDGSKDGSGEICEKFFKKDSRILFINQENKGEAAARNAGLAKARGKYLTFVDADDYVEEDFVWGLYELVHEGERDIGILSYREEEEGGSLRREYRLKEAKWQDGSGFLRFLNLDLIGGVWNKIFRNALIREKKLSFATDIKHGPDQLFIGEYLAHSESGAVSGEIKYHYRYIENSISKEDVSKKKFKPERMSWITSAERLEKYCHGDERLLSAYESFLAYRLQDTLFLMKVFDYEDREAEENIRRRIRKTKRSWKKSPVMSKKTKLLMWISGYSMWLYTRIVKAYGRKNL